MKSGISQTHRYLIWKELSRLKQNKRFRSTKNYLQHGRTSVYKHCINVAYTSVWLAERFGRHVDWNALIRGALLHDYFLYDWHNKFHHHPRPHGFFHPSISLANAQQDYRLGKKERVIIKRHMFPLTLVPPGCTEAWIVCLADKICSWCEIEWPNIDWKIVSTKDKLDKRGKKKL